MFLFDIFFDLVIFYFRMRNLVMRLKNQMTLQLSLVSVIFICYQGGGVSFISLTDYSNFAVFYHFDFDQKR